MCPVSSPSSPCWEQPATGGWYAYQGRVPGDSCRSSAAISPAAPRRPTSRGERRAAGLRAAGRRCRHGQDRPRSSRSAKPSARCAPSNRSPSPPRLQASIEEISFEEGQKVKAGDVLRRPRRRRAPRRHRAGHRRDQPRDRAARTRSQIRLDRALALQPHRRRHRGAGRGPDRPGEDAGERHRVRRGAAQGRRGPARGPDRPGALRRAASARARCRSAPMFRPARASPRSTTCRRSGSISRSRRTSSAGSRPARPSTPRSAAFGEPRLQGQGLDHRPPRRSGHPHASA